MPILVLISILGSPYNRTPQVGEVGSLFYTAGYYTKLV